MQGPGQSCQQHFIVPGCAFSELAVGNNKYITIYMYSSTYMGLHLRVARAAYQIHTPMGKTDVRWKQDFLVHFILDGE